MLFSVHENVNHPVSLFTVYGPWDRTDMVLQKFTCTILAGEKIQVFDYSKYRRDFTCINDENSFPSKL